MKYSILFFLFFLVGHFSAQDITFSANKRLVEPVINGEVKPENTVEIKSTLIKQLKGKKNLHLDY